MMQNPDVNGDGVVSYPEQVFIHNKLSSYNACFNADINVLIANDLGTDSNVNTVLGRATYLEIDQVSLTLNNVNFAIKN